MLIFLLVFLTLDKAVDEWMERELDEKRMVGWMDAKRVGWRDDSRDVSPVCKDMEAEVSTNSRQISACVVWNYKQLRNTSSLMFCFLRSNCETCQKRSV